MARAPPKNRSHCNINMDLIQPIFVCEPPTWPELHGSFVSFLMGQYNVDRWWFIDHATEICYNVIIIWYKRRDWGLFVFFGKVLNLSNDEEDEGQLYTRCEE